MIKLYLLYFWNSGYAKRMGRQIKGWDKGGAHSQMYVTSNVEFFICELVHGFTLYHNKKASSHRPK